MVRTEPKQRLSGSNVQSQSEAAVVLLQPPVLPQGCLGPVVISEQGQQICCFLFGAFIVGKPAHEERKKQENGKQTRVMSIKFFWGNAGLPSSSIQTCCRISKCQAKATIGGEGQKRERKRGGGEEKDEKEKRKRNCLAARVAEPPKAAVVQQELEGAQHQHATSSWCLCLLWRHLRKVFSQKNRALQSVQEGLSPLQLSAKQVQDVLSAAIPAVTAVVCGTGNPRTTFLLCLGVRGLQAGLACQSLSRRVVLRLLAPLCTIPSLAWGQMLEPSSAVRLLVDLVVKPVLVLLQARLWHPA
ncbi:hypothetical protein Anapl_03018 [Anas platyrhynchos]|uniref:Uncharacterized protein n=1 Tax=Anas platyrhynchos TaxID=8839 RepID=R0KYA6_ANAPL|nr:hypothetical protein Anapl_03018 [Anas platyrhynchos]